MLAVRKTIQNEYQSEAAQLPVGKARQKTKSRQNPWGRYFLAVVMVVAVAISVTGRYAQIARTNYEVAKLKYAVTVLEKEHETLQINVASLKAPGRVQKIAASRLGMQLPEKIYYAAARLSDSQKQGTETASIAWSTVKAAEAHSSR